MEKSCRSEAMMIITEEMGDGDDSGGREGSPKFYIYKLPINRPGGRILVVVVVSLLLLLLL